jgi:hypothetical protein
MTKLNPICILTMVCLFVAQLLTAQNSTNLTDKTLSFPAKSSDSVLNKVTNKASCFEKKVIGNPENNSKIDQALTLPDKLFSGLDKKCFSIEEKLNRQMQRYLTRLQKREHKLKKKLWKRDSTIAKQLFEGVDEKYNHLKTGVSSIGTTSSVYSGHLDSITTALNYLSNNNLTNNPALQKSLEQYKKLQSNFNASEQAMKYITQRRELLKGEFERLGKLRELKKFRKDIYYYQQQIKDYKELFEDPNKLEAKLMEIVLKSGLFKDFFQKYSMLGSMFALPGNNSNTTASLQGLQTRATINQSFIDRFGSGSAVTQQLQQNIQAAQGQLNQLKNKLSSLSNGSYGNTGEDEIPGFKPNSQKTKSFLQRLEYGANMQSQGARYFFPVTSDIAVSLGYKINDRSVVGIEAAYKLGWGKNINNIRITHQGIGLRSYLSWKIKGSNYITGGYEQNYRNLINSVAQLKDVSAWQTSGLIGVSRKYRISKKVKGEMKLLWDFMSYSQTPRSQPILFRVGYSLK